MKMTSRVWLACFCAAMLGSVNNLASAQEFPNKAITIIANYGPGSGNDLIARELSQKLSEQMKTPVIVENKVGATGNIAMDYVAQGKPDGYTMVLSSTSSIIYQASNTIRTIIAKDFTPIAFVAGLPYVLSVPPSVPAKTLKELAAIAKAKPGELNYNGPAGSMSAFIGSLFKSSAGVDMVMVPYKATSDAQIDVLAGRIQLWITTSASAFPLVKSGKVTVLAVTGQNRLSSIPDVPTAIESGFPDLSPDISFFLLGPPGIPAPIVTKLNQNINAVLKTPAMAERLANLATTVKMGSPEEVQQHLIAETARWQAAVKNEVLSK